MEKQKKEDKSVNIFLFSETKNILSEENAKKKNGFMHSLVKPLEVALLGSGVLAAFLVGMLFKPILSVDEAIAKNFSKLSATLRDIQLNTQKLNRACKNPVNEAEALEYQNTLGDLGVSLVNIAHDDLGRLISPQTFCALREVTSGVSHLVSSKNPCDNVPRFSKKQITYITTSIGIDKSNVNTYFEYFYKNRNKVYTDEVCEKKTE